MQFLQYGTCMVATSADALVTALFNVLQHSCCHHTWNVTLSGFKTSLHSKRILCFGPSRNDNWFSLTFELHLHYSTDTMVMGPISLPPPVDEQSLKKIHPFFKAYPALLPRFIIYFCASRTCNVRKIAAPTTVVRCGHVYNSVCFCLISRTKRSPYYRNAITRSRVQYITIK